MSGLRAALHRNRHEAYGLTALIVLLAILALVVAAYFQAFTPFVVATVKTDRAGLLLQRDSDVSMRSVGVGKVGDIRPDGDRGALVDIKIYPSQVEFIPANVGAQIVAPTVFGPKYVDLIAPEHPVPQRISSGQVIEPRRVQVETNVVFDHLMTTLTTVKPSKVNSTLGAMSTALRGHGDRYGRFLTDLNAYLVRFNPNLPSLRGDLAILPGVVDTYADASPDLVEIVKNATTTGDTLVESDPAVDRFLGSVTGFSDDARGFFADNERGLDQTLDVLRPTTAMLERYSPMFPCLFHSANTLRHYTEPAFGGTVPGLHTLTSFGPGQEGYKYPANLPKLGIDAPGCYGGAPKPGTVPRHEYFDDGSPRLDTRSHPEVTLGDKPLALILFGDLGPGVRDRARQLGGANAVPAPAVPHPGGNR